MGGRATDRAKAYFRPAYGLPTALCFYPLWISIAGFAAKNQPNPQEYWEDGWFYDSG